MTPDEIRSIVRDELASLGGHLLATYGQRAGDVADDPRNATYALATLGGYLLEEYGPDTTTPGGTA